MDLTLGGAGTDGAPADGVGQVFSGDGVEELAADGQSQIEDLEQEGTRIVQAVVDPEGAVKMRVVDETLPADGGPRLLEVRPHHDEQVIRELRLELGQAFGVLQPGHRIVQ